MPRIYVQFSGLDQVGTHCKTVASKVDAIKSDFQSTISALDWDVRFADDIDNTAKQISRKLGQQTKALRAYQRFLNDAYQEYVKLDEYIQTDSTLIDGSDSFFDYDWKDIVKSLGNIGSIFGVVDSIHNANRWDEWAKSGLSAGKTISKIAKDYNNYAKIGCAIGTNNSTAYFWKKQLGFRTTGHASTASSPTARFYNNLHNTTSPYNLKDAFSSLTGKKGVGTTAAAWAGVVLTGVSNWYSNKDEQKASNGTMSTGRVVAETITETAIDTVVAYAGTAVVGAAITAATGVVAAPVAVAVATGVAIAGINAGVKACTGKTATEWASDLILDTASAVCDSVANGAKAVAGWFNRLSFA